MAEEYDTSWDLVDSEKGNLPINEEAYEKKWREWDKRNWVAWLRENLTCPFLVERTEDEDDAYFTDIADREPLRLGHKMEIVEVMDDEGRKFGIEVEVREGNSKGYVPLADCEVAERSDKNFWPVREYAVWLANS